MMRVHYDSFIPEFSAVTILAVTGNQILLTTPTFKALEKIMAETPAAIVCVGMAGKLARLLFVRALLQSSSLSIRIWKNHIHAKNQLLSAFKT